MKFGGTSVGTPERIKDVAALVLSQEEPVLVVLSAMSGTTNALLEIAAQFYAKDDEAAQASIEALEAKYLQHTAMLYASEEVRQQVQAFLHEKFDYLRTFESEYFTTFEEKNIVAQGEIMSTAMFAHYVNEVAGGAVLLNALDFMRTDKNGEPDMPYIHDKLAEVMTMNTGFQVYVTQGFICMNAFGETDNLQRGGSDYTASLIGAALPASEIQIWTDIDGMHNNDPREVEKTHPVRQLHFDEAAELAYFGAKILHPTCISPAKKAKIPVRLKNTMQPEAEGTLINDTLVEGKIKAVAVKNNITAIRVKSTGMLVATGFLHKVFEIFESFQTPIDMLCTSEAGISMAIDDITHLKEIVEELSHVGVVAVDSQMCIVCVVGDLNWSNLGYENIVINALKDIPIRMISYGASNYNISFLVRQQDKRSALNKLSENLFYNNEIS